MAANDNTQFALQDFNHRMMEIIGSLRQSSQKIESGLVNGGDIKQMRALCLECMKSKIYLYDEHADLMILITEIKKQAQENPNSIAYLKLLEESLANIKKLSEMFGSTYQMVNKALLVMATQNENVTRTEIQKTAGQTRGAAPAAIHDLSTASGSYTAGGIIPWTY